MAHVLRDNGYSTFWVGKNHNVPVDAWTQGSSSGEIVKVVFDVADDAYVDLESHYAAAMSRD
jgi:arylsulfatase A-like enzyme